MINDENRAARVAYEAYCVAVNGVAWNGDELPRWDSITGENVKAGWVAAVQAVADYQAEQGASRPDDIPEARDGDDNA